MAPGHATDLRKDLVHKVKPMVLDLFNESILTRHIREIDGSEGSITFQTDTQGYALFSVAHTGTHFESEFNMWENAFKEKFKIARKAVDYTKGIAGYKYHLANRGAGQ